MNAQKVNEILAARQAIIEVLFSGKPTRRQHELVSLVHGLPSHATYTWDKCKCLVYDASRLYPQDFYIDRGRNISLTHGRLSREKFKQSLRRPPGTTGMGIAAEAMEARRA